MNSNTKVVLQKELIENVLNNFTDTINSQIHIYPNDIKKMLNYIHDHLFESTLTVAKVKSECGFTNNNIVTRFRNEVGIKPREYIIKKRLEAAAELLNLININIFIIAQKIGDTEEAFSRIFKKVYGCSPLHFKETQKRKYHKNPLRNLVKTKNQEKISREKVKSL